MQIFEFEEFPKRSAGWDLSSYSGSLRSGKRHGIGTQKFLSQFVYTGKWQNDFPHGYGKFYLKDVISYEGKIINFIYKQIVRFEYYYI